METRTQILSLLGEVKRPGMDAVIGRLDKLGYFDARCYGHHRYRGGMADHALEVCDFALRHAPQTLSRDSIVIATLFHDFGKASGARRFRGGHPARSLAVLDECGLALTGDERIAIGGHHRKDHTFFTHPLRRAVSRGDMDSTGRWKAAHPKTTDSRKHR